MSKENKKKKEEIDAQAKAEMERREAIAQFNVSNMGKYWIDKDRIPTDDEIAQAKADYEKKAKELQDAKYTVADKDNSLRVAKFMKNFNDSALWTQRMFVGVINFSALMNDFIESYDENDPKELILDYAPAQYAFTIFENYGGIGIESAKHMADIWDEYLPIYDRLHEIIDQYKSEAEACEELKNRWGMLAQGYYLHIMENAEVDPIEEIGNAETPTEVKQEEKAE